MQLGMQLEQEGVLRSTPLAERSEASSGTRDSAERAERGPQWHSAERSEAFRGAQHGSCRRNTYRSTQRFSD